MILTVACMVAVVTGGCARRHKSPTTQPTRIATDIDPETATAEYWLSRPAAATVQVANYEHLFSACDHVLRQRYFQVDRSDFRDGIVTSRPLISQQIWEFWRQDVGTYSQEMKSSLATYRRTVHWTITADPAGGYVATPRVVVERYTTEPRRLTAVTSYRSAANSASAQTRLDSPRIAAIQPNSWYAVGRDTFLEADLAKHASDWLIGK